MSLYSVDSSTGDIDLLAGSTKYADNPIGTILPYGGTTAPSGWFLCQGQAISRTDYSDLFAVIGTAFGSGNGSTTFNIPDLRESVPVGVGENDIQTIANHDVYTLGEFKDDNLGKHDHPLTVTTRATYNTAGVPVGVGNNNTPTTATHGKQLGVNYIIKAKHIPVPADFKDAIDDAVEEALDGIGTVYTRQISVQAIEGGDWHVLDSVSVSGLPNGNYLICLKGTPNVISQNFTSIVQIDGRGVGHSMAGGSYPYLSDSIIYTKSNDNAIGVSVYIPTNSSLEAGTIYFDFVRLS